MMVKHMIKKQLCMNIIINKCSNYLTLCLIEC